MPSLDQLRTLLSKAPDDPFLLYGLGIEHARLGQIEEACEAFDRCLLADPAQCYAYYHKARAQHEAGHTQAAIATLRAGLFASRTHKDSHAQSEIQALLDEIE